MKRALVLMYHGISPCPQGVWDVAADEIASHVRGFRDQGLRVGTLHETLTGCEDTIVLTFDDAYTSVYDNAWPVLDASGVTGTVFVPVNYVGGLNAYDCLSNFGPRQPSRIMNWAQLRELADAGWSIQSHGCSHFPVGSLGKEYLEDDLQRSKQTIEDRVGHEVTGFAYPFGVPDGFDEGFDLEGMLRRSGYRYAVVANGGWVTTPPQRPFLISRYPARSGLALPPPG